MPPGECYELVTPCVFRRKERGGKKDRHWLREDSGWWQVHLYLGLPGKSFLTTITVLKF